MPLLNPPDILPEAMRFLLRALLARPDRSAPAETLLGLVAPAGMAEAMKALGAGDEAEEGDEPAAGGGRRIADTSLDALNALELVAFDGPRTNRTVAPTATIMERFPGPEALTAPAFASFLRGHILLERFANPPAGQAGAATDLAEALALFHLMPEPLRPFVSFDGADRAFQRGQRAMLGIDRTRWPVTNPVQYQSFVRWAVYLGFANPVPSGGRSLAIVPDASGAIADHLAEVVPRARPIGSVVADLGSLIPTFDGGHLQRRIQADLTASLPEGWVSPGLAFTLNRLHHGRRIRLETRSDTAVLQLPVGAMTAAFSHVGPGEGGG
jgi:hypothetical protein